MAPRRGTPWNPNMKLKTTPTRLGATSLGVCLLACNSLAAAALEGLDLEAIKDLPPLKYTKSPAKIPNYPAGKRWGTLAEPIDTMQLPLSPEESAARIVTLPGFKAELWASEPQIFKPVCMAFDERGRLWIAETMDYPNEQQPDGEGRDRITICEDTDGDGRADKFSMFADKLTIPTGMVFAGGGLIVKHAGEMLLLKDTNGDGKADVRKSLFSGWGMRDTHATASNLRHGFDGWIWGTVGYSGFNGTVGGKQLRFGQGVFRFKPDGSELEFVKSSNNNTWGLGLSEDNIVFGSTANNNASFYMPIPNRYYEGVRGWSAAVMGTIADSQAIYPVTPFVRQVDSHNRYTAGAGSALYTARAFPKEYWNQVSFVAEPTGHLVGQFLLEDSGADFAAVNKRSFLASDDEWFAPIMAEVGPDGALWILDWYNYIIQHNPTPAGFNTGRGAAYETPLRDKTHGRIYRVAHSVGAKGVQGAKPAVKSLHNASVQGLVAALRDDNQLWRMHAQRLLVERGGKDAVPALCELARDTSRDELGLNVGAVHALWTLRGLGALDAAGSDAAKAAMGALKHPSSAVRRAALMTLPRDNGTTAAILSGKLLEDADAQARMAALLALAELPASGDAGSAVLAMLREERNIGDRWIPHAATAAAARHEAGFLKAALAASNPPEGLGAVIQTVSGHYASRGPVDSIVSTVLALNKAAPLVATSMLDGLAANWPRGVAPDLSADAGVALNTLVPLLPNEARSALLTLSDRWGKKELFAGVAASVAQALRAQVANLALDLRRRADAAKRLLANDDSADSAAAILAQITPSSEPALAAGLLGALSESRQPQTAQALVGSFPNFTPAARRTALATLMRRPEWTQELLNAVEAKKLERGDLAADTWAQLKGHPNRAIAAKAQALDKTASFSSAEMEAVVAKLMPIASMHGDAAKGRELFAVSCAICHTFNGEGAKVGPDLTGVGAKPKADILIDIIDPNRSVEANFRMWSVTTRDGENYSGQLDSETATSVDILDTTGRKHTLQRKDVAEIKTSNLSVMPAGFDQLPPGDLAAILEYLASTPHDEARK